VKRLQGLNLFASAGKLDRLPRDVPYRQRGPAAAVAIELGQDVAGDANVLVKRPGQIGSFLARHGIDHQQDFVRRDGLFNARQLGHHVVIDLLAPGRIDDGGIDALLAGPLDPLAGDLDRIGLRALFKNRNLGLLTQRDELIYRSRPVDVSCDHEGAALLFAQVQGQLGRGRGLAAALQAGHQHDRGRGFGLG